METMAQAARRLGVKRPEQLPDLLELPAFAEALAAAQANPEVSIHALVVAHRLPSLPKATMSDDDVLDVEKLHAEAVTLRLRRERLEDIGRRGDGTTRSPERVEGSGVMLGRMEKFQKQAEHRLRVLEQVDSLLVDTTNNGLPAVTNVEAARTLIRGTLP